MFHSTPISSRALTCFCPLYAIFTVPFSVSVTHAKVGEEDHRAPATEEVEEFRDWDGWLAGSKIPETSYFQSEMHFDDSVMKFKLVVDSDTTVDAVHTHTVAFSP